MTKLILGVDLSFAKKRWPLPEEWLDIVKNQLGLSCVEFDTDFLDPLFISEPTWMDIACQTRKLAADYGVEIHNYFTGAMTHCVNLLSHPDERIRLDGMRWCEKAIQLAGKLGARGIGGHFDTITSNDLNDPRRYKLRVDDLVTSFHHLSKLAGDAGQEFILWEQIYAPCEMPYTIDQSREFMARLNDGAHVPIPLVIDLGHMCCQNFAHKSEDIDPYEWLRQLGHMTSVVHLQQCSGTGSSHWPFTKEYNARGIIDARKTIEAINESGAREMYLFFEIFFSLTQTDQQILDQMKESVDYWRNCL
jgi:sugar phosphate isomerase/epimerase